MKVHRFKLLPMFMVLALSISLPSVLFADDHDANAGQDVIQATKDQSSQQETTTGGDSDSKGIDSTDAVDTDAQNSAEGSSDQGAPLSQNSDSNSQSSEESKSISGRTVEKINEGWSFSTNDSTQEGWGFPDGRSSGQVNLPHSWEYVHPTKSYIPIFNKKTATYTKTLDVSKYQGRRLYIKFYGVSKNAEVLVDGESVGTHVGGYTAFVFDITDKIQGKSQVTLTVNVTNVDTDSIPINVDYTQWAGIYRDVELISTEDQHFSLLNNGSEGLFVDYSLSNGNADLKVKADVANNADSKSVKVKSQVRDAQGNVVSDTTQPLSLESNKDFSEVSLSQRVTNVHRWNGIDDPYLYNVRIQLLDDDDAVLDEVVQSVGFRTFRVSDGSAYLNGKKIQIHGVGYHQDRQGCGNAVTSDQISADFDQMLDMGVNFIRASHYPHDQSFYDLADQKGILVYNEIPYYMIYSKAQSYKDSITNQLIEMTRQNYNHTCVVMDGIQNEVVYNSSFKNYGPDFDVTSDEIIAFNKGLVTLVRKEDPSRMVVQATIDGLNNASISKLWSSDIDLTGLNLYIGFKSGVSSAGDSGRKELAKKLNSKLDSYKSIYGVNNLMLSEYGAGANINQHTEVDDAFSWDGNDSSNNHYEEYQSFIHEVYWDTISKRNDLPITCIWNMFDFSCYRNEGGVPRTNTKGLICYDHSTRKDAYYFYKANWNTKDSFVYLTSKRFLNRNRAIEDFKVYSNCDKVQLFVNGSSIGYGEKQQSGVFVWKNVKLTSHANNSIRAVGERNGATYEDSVDGITVPDTPDINVTYRSHVRNIGWQDSVQNGSVSGTVGKSLPMEAFKIQIDGSTGGVLARAHVQNIGWQDWKKGSCGTTGKSQQMEAIRLKLTDSLADEYDIYYRVHIADKGWLGWASNGAPAGSVGKSLGIQAIQVVLVKKGEAAPGSTDTPFIGVDTVVSYKAHVSNIGWQSEVSDGAMAGTTGRGLSIEALSAAISSDPDALELNAHVQNIGWQGWKNGQCGTTGRGLQIEAIKIRLKGSLSNNYDVYYRVHSANFGWLDWAKNGLAAGSQGYSYGMQAIEIQLVKKGGKAPGITSTPFRQPAVVYQAHVSNIGWMSSVYDGNVAGTTGKNLPMEALKLSLGDDIDGSIEAMAHVSNVGWEKKWSTSIGTTGKSQAIEAVRIRLKGNAAEKYDVVYRVHSTNIGWSSWKKDGKKAGTTGYGLPVQAIQIKLVAKK